MLSRDIRRDVLLAHVTCLRGWRRLSRDRVRHVLNMSTVNEETYDRCRTPRQCRSSRLLEPTALDNLGRCHANLPHMGRLVPIRGTTTSHAKKSSATSTYALSNWCLCDVYGRVSRRKRQKTWTNV
ncbi:hypothetical protein BHM03_00043846 [Ensete ventricosum]|nr:hypothetical protein BHM03_00043846 [Ensete ventricosum]